MHIHKYGPWENKVLLNKQYISGYASEEQIFMQVKYCTVCGKAKKHQP